MSHSDLNDTPELTYINPNWTGRTYMSLPRKRTKQAYMSYYCDATVASFLCHLEHHELGGATKIITLWSGDHELLNYGEQCFGKCPFQPTFDVPKQPRSRTSQRSQQANWHHNKKNCIYQCYGHITIIKCQSIVKY